MTSWCWPPLTAKTSHHGPLSWMKALMFAPAVTGVFAAAWADQHGVALDPLWMVSVTAALMGGLVRVGALALLRRIGA